MAKLKLGVKTVYFPFLVVCGILIGTLVLSGMQNGVIRGKIQILWFAHGVKKTQKFHNS